MFRPVSFSGRIFKSYLLMRTHPTKIRVQNIIGKTLFTKGITLKNENGVSFILEANDWITRIILREGNYESGSTDLASRLLQSGGSFLDIGANFGLFTCMAAHKNKKINVLAVEPNYKILKNLIDNVQRNYLEDRVHIINSAISKKFQPVTLMQPASDNLGTTVAKPGIMGPLSILSCPLEFIFKEYNLSVVDLLKIDIEGNEFEVLEDFPFEKYEVKNILMEFNHLSKRSFEEIKSFFCSKNFKCYSISGIELFTEYQEIPENNIWFVNQHLINVQ